MNNTPGFLNIQEWMLELELKPTELIAYAIVYGFSQDGKSMFFGGLDYIMKWCKISRNAACSVMNRLVKKGLITKVESRDGVIKYANYKANLNKISHTRNLYRAIQETGAASIQETCIKKNKTIINKENIKIEVPDLSLDIDLSESLQDKMRRYENA